MITIRILLPYKDLFGKNIRINEERMKMEELLLKLSKHIGSDPKQYLYDESDQLRKNINILINGISIEPSNIPKIEVKNGDNVAITVIAGGG